MRETRETAQQQQNDEGWTKNPLATLAGSTASTTDDGQATGRPIYSLVTLMRGRKRAVLLAPGGALWSDRHERDRAIEQQITVGGWREAEIRNYYPGCNVAGTTAVIIAGEVTP